ncbi:Uncharacterised protein [Pragia fontium]|nr:Uncharacterised protein [Pragia fontium]
MGHRWKMAPTNVQQGKWCAQCARLSRNANYLHYLKDYAKAKGGQCLSTEFIHSSVKLCWKCQQGHEWQAVSRQIISEHTWCPICANDKKRGTLAKMQKLATSRGGECLSTQYNNAKEKLRWKCEKGHMWDAIPANVKSGGWCPICAFNIPDIKKMKEVAKKRGGDCLSSQYVNYRTKLHWICKLGHTWMATPNSILSRKSWCPACAILASCRHDKSRRKYLLDNS